MKNFLLLVVFAIACSGCSRPDQPAAATSEDAPGDVADAVYINGKIYTVNEDQPWAEAMAVRDGEFTVVGSNVDVETVIGKDTAVTDLDGRMAMPGLIDPHVHLMGAAIGKANLYLSNPNDKDAMLAEIKEFADSNPDLPYIRGEAWNLGVFEDNSPRKEWLDEIAPDRPVYFYSQTGHEAWVNSATIDLIDLDNREQDNRYVWVVDPETGKPTGTIKEYTMSLVEQALGATDPERLATEMAVMIEVFNSQGFTSLREAGAEIWTVEAANLLDNRGELTARLFPAWFHLGHIGAMSAEDSRAVAARWEEYRTPMVYPRYVKMYADGSSSSHTSLLHEDYADRPGFKGATSFTLEELVDDFSFFNGLGLGMIVHVYGDGTSETVIEAFESVRNTNGDNGAPLHFSHSFMTTPEQIDRLADITDVSMDFITLQYPHPAIIGSFVPSIGEERYQRWINVRHAAETGIPFSFGSDWPASLSPVLNGFYEMQGFVTRKDPSNPGSETLNADQAITLEQALYGYTQGAAYALGYDWPDRLGSIEEGKLADFIVVDRNIFESPIETLKDTQVEMTVVGGELVFDGN